MSAVVEDRFAFGKNWSSYAALVDEKRLEAAKASLLEPLGLTSLAGLSFLDIGSGSGLFSLAAHELGANVTSFDYDRDAVDTALSLRERFGIGPQWTVRQGSVLDPRLLAELGQFDIVYSWGVLHHTGAMWQAIEGAASCVGPGGLFFLSIYNDQGMQSRMWTRIKRRYVRSGKLGQWVLLRAAGAYFGSRAVASRLLRGSLIAAPRPRGMSASHDLVDWVGGYPFEVAGPDQIFAFLRRSGFQLRHLKTVGGGLGCNEFVFERQ